MLTGRERLRQYAYVPPDTPQFRVPPLSRAQAAPQQFRRAPAANNNSDPGPPPSRSVSRQNMPPSQFSFGQRQQQQQRPRAAQNATAGSSNTSRGAQQRQTTNMGPPPTPRLGAGARTNGFASPSRRFMPPTPANAQAQTQDQRRFFPMPNGSDQNAGPSTRNAASASRPQQEQKVPSGGAETRAEFLNVGNAGSGAQRMPFLPGGNKQPAGTSGLKVFKPR